MADNDRVQYNLRDEYYGQLANSQANRTNFTPGDPDGKALDMNWPTDFRIPTGVPAFDESIDGPEIVTRVRVVKLHRNSVSDQVQQGVPADSEGETTLENDGRFERNSGYDWATE